MHAAFGTVVVVVSVVAIVLAVIALARSGHTWSDYGKGRLVMDRDLSPAPGGPPAAGEREAEIRSMLEARNARRLRRGDDPVDVEAELARLTAPGVGPGPAAATAPSAPGVDPELREEVRQLVIARNHRRERAGRPPLDVEAEVDRELRRLTEP